MRQVRATLNISANRGTRHICLVAGVVAFILLVILATNVPYAHSAPLSTTLRDACGHTLHRPSGFFKRHFDSKFLIHFFKHWIPFTSRMRVKMQFFLYKRDFEECGREIVADDDNSLEMSDFNPEHPTRIIIHGWMSQSKGALNRLVKSAYLSLVKRVPPPQPQQQPHAQLAVEVASGHSATRTANDIATDSPTIGNHFQGNNIDDEVDSHQNDVNAMNTTNNNINENNTNNNNHHPSDYNIIICDWSVISSNVNYFSVVELVEDLGHLLAEFVNFLHIRTGLSYDDVYLIGHSLGAQIAGSAGKQAYPFRFNTIFALDPAGPWFRNQTPDHRVDASDAEYVESIQTSSSLGFEEPLGHATFYPNYGRDQKKCYIYGCSHKRAYHYFAESITSEVGFWGVLCRRQSDDLWIFSNSGAEFRMGGEPSSPKRGTYYVKTADRPPYALGRNIQPQRLITPAIDDESEERVEIIQGS